MQPLNKVASGGERARFLLALKSVLAHIHSTPVVVLDEIDTTFVSHYSSRISLPEAITVDAVKDYGARKTGQKTLLKVAESSP